MIENKNGEKKTFSNFIKTLTRFAIGSVMILLVRAGSFRIAAFCEIQTRKTTLQERLDSLTSRRKMASEIDIEEVTDESKTLVLIKIRLEPNMF